MHFNPTTIAPILCSLFSLFAGVFVLINNPRSQLNRIFFFICIDILAWFSFYIPFNFSLSEPIVIAWFKVSYCFISFLPIMCFTFVTTYLALPKNEFWYKINSIIGLIFGLISLFTDEIIKGVNYFPWHPYPQAGNLHFLLIIHCTYLTLMMLGMLKKAIKEPDLTSKRRNQLKYIIISICILAIGMWDFMANYNIPVFPIGEYTSTFFLFVVSYAIIKHQLMDITVVIKKGLVYSLLVTCITLTYLIVVLLIERIFNNYLGYQNLTTSLITAIFIALVFIPLKNVIQDLIDRLFYKGTQIEIINQNELLRQEVAQTERLKSIAILASGLAHEIKNPLTVLKTFGEYFPSKIDDKEFLHKFAPLVNKEVDRINILLQELLAFSKPSPIQLEPVNVENIIESTVVLSSSSAAKNNIRITFKKQSQPIILNIDPNKFQQALLNIILNAIDAMPHNGEITLTSAITNNKYQIQIKDTGDGIEATDLPHVFDPFFTTKSQGTGLGLSITHDIITKHNGKIFVRSKRNSGTTFTIELPL